MKYIKPRASHNITEPCHYIMGCCYEFISSYRVIGAFLVAHLVKDLPANVGDLREVGSIPGSGRSPREGNVNVLQDSYLKNSMDRGTWWAIVHKVAKSNTNEHAYTSIHTAIHRI